MYEDLDIIMLSSARSDDAYSSSAISLAKELSKKNRVFFIDHPFSLKDFVKFYKSGERIRSRTKALLFGKNNVTQLEGTPANFNLVTTKLTLPINWLKKGLLYSTLSGVNDAILISTLKSILIDYKVERYIFVNVFVPYYFKKIPQSILPELSIYFTVDDISQEPYIAKHGVRLEKIAITNADIALATSKELTKYIEKFSSNAFHLPNAADTELFSKAETEVYERPLELAFNNKKVICYTGNIGSRLNYSLLKKIAEKHSDKILLLVGPISNNDYRIFGLDKFSNVIFTGPQHITDLPAYLQYSDCTIIPFEYSTQTKSIYPLKINEYLAAGKPVISTAFSEDIKDFSDVVYVSNSEENFVANIEQAIQENSDEKKFKRISKAQLNNWSARTEQFWRIVDRTWKKKYS